jgi:AraC family transcriptional regulator of adaptative response/methylated-DNA-[protein]-cysteine methyltransferase
MRAASRPASTSSPHRYATDQQRWRAVRRRDAAAAGCFVYAVATTGIYCRPGCPSRLALRRNVVFHDCAADAQRAGFRPCKRCRPDAATADAGRAAAMVAACRRIEAAEGIPPLAALAAEAGLSPHHFLRAFKEQVGVTPRQYAAARRAARVQQRLRAGGSITAAMYGAGFNASSRFYAQSSAILGMTPRQYRAAGAGVAIRYAMARCRLGLALVAVTPRGVCALHLGDDEAELLRELRGGFPRAEIAPADPAAGAWIAAVIAHLDHPARGLDLPLDIRGTAFQQRVWTALRAIPPGRTTSYGELAARLGRPTAARAVARACATNSVAVLVPCHRVVAADGSLTGYRWGLARKRALLDSEKEEKAD